MVYSRGPEIVVELLPVPLAEPEHSYLHARAVGIFRIFMRSGAILIKNRQNPRGIFLGKEPRNLA